MAGDSKPSGPNLGGNAFVWVAMVAAVLAYLNRPIDLANLRPPADQFATTRTDTVQDIDARLWQDPFDPVLKADGAYYGWSSASGRKIGSKPTVCSPNDSHRVSPLSGENASAQLIGVIVPGGPYSEDAEFRRRTRYAVLAALDVLHYTPKDAQHIGVFIPPQPTIQQDGSQSDVSGLQFVPYEVLERGQDRVILIWLDEDSLADHPLERLVRLIRVLHPPPMNGFRVKILGPQGSDTLLAMLQHTSEWAEASGQGAPAQSGQRQATGGARPSGRPAVDSVPGLDLYDYSATADPAALCRETGDKGCRTHKDWVAWKFRQAGISFSRATATDDVLARAISAELTRRGIHPGSAHVALISEWDTFYGRKLPETFARCLSVGSNGALCDERRTDDQINQRTNSWLSRYSYLRGLDGQTPAAETPTQPSHPATSDPTTTKTSANAPGNLLSETAQGEGQGDYLARLATELRRQDERLRNQGGDGIRAVGVLGSDLYDKLVVLQAAKAALPRALFFTTDLDERLISPTRQLSTVNLIVASGLGLSLRHHLQQDVPPFRGSYQTAAFLATLMAACKAGNASADTASNCTDSGSATAASDWFERASTYEIGRSRPIELPQREDGPATSRPGDCATGSGQVDVFACGSILPNDPPPSVSTPRLLGLAFLEAGAALALLVFLLRLAMGSQHVAAEWVFAALLAAAVAAIQLLHPGLFAPIDVSLLFQGVSLWPSICVQLLSVAFGVAVIFKIRRSSNENLSKLRTRLRMSETLEELEGKRRSFRLLDALPFGVRPWKAKSGSNGEAKHEAGDPDDALARFWTRYLDYGRHHMQFYRVVALTGLGLGAAWAVYLAFPWPSPTAGAMTHAIYNAVAFADALMTLAVTFYVADVMLFSRLFVREAFARDNPAPVWPLRAKEAFAKLSLHAEYAPNSETQDALVTTTMTIAYVSERTTCITPFIYYPFIMIAISVISHSPVLGPPTFGPWAIAIEAISLLAAFISAIALRSAAEDARAETVRHINILKWQELNAGSSPESRERLDMLIERVTALREGAFSPLSQQPVVRALLLPLASYGSTLLLSILSAGG